ncbi:MAG TPA: hypothetical protein VFO49_15215 [Nocardioides sp.]|nr:hypothetical protein [Nocardioides sp.]
MSQATSSTSTTAFGALARHEIKSYARHPLFIIGVLLTALICADGPDKASSSLFHVIVPGVALGVFGLLIMAGLVRRSDKTYEAAGTVVVTERTRTLALATATVVPFTAGLLFFGWAVWAWNDSPPLDYTIPFGGIVGDGWVYAWLFALGTISAVGGPVLGLVVGRWLHFRGAAILVAVALILATITMQGLIEPLRYIRVFMPWTYFGGPLGVEGDADRWLIMTGSPQWYCAYLVALCGLGVLIALLHDREQPRAGLAKVTAGVAVLALALGTMAMTTGVTEEHVNPLPSPNAW